MKGSPLPLIIRDCSLKYKYNSSPNWWNVHQLLDNTSSSDRDSIPKHNINAIVVRINYTEI